MTIIGIEAAFLIGGLIVTETVFSMNGLGYLAWMSISRQDFPVVQVFVAIFAALFILSNILTDVLYALVDPRVRLS